MAKVIVGRRYKLKIYQCHNKHFDITSKLIEFHQRSNYSHIAIGFVSETGREMIIDSTRKNISIYPAYEYWSERYDNVGELCIETDGTRKDFLRVIEPFLGRDYPERQIIAILFKIASFSNGSKKMTCNELALRIVLELKKEFKFEGNLDTVDLNGTWAALKKVSNG